jgi:LCP family protein required for cell wall assembly
MGLLGFSMKQIKRLLLIILALSLPGCNLPGFPILAGGKPAEVNPIIVMAAANATATPTPFQPLAPTPTYLPTSFPTPILPVAEATAAPAAPEEPGIQEGESRTWADYPGPVEWPDIAIPEPVGVLPQPANQVNILILGSDQRPDEGGFRTDAMILATLNPDLGTVNLTSFPRDLYVYIPGWTVHKLNTAHAHGGFPLTQMTFEYNFGVKPDHFVMVQMNAFKDVIDSLGGIDVQVAETLTDWRDHYGYYTVNPGNVHMDGEVALWYARSRYSTSDLVRNRRQQEVLEAILAKLLSLQAVERAPELYQAYVNNVTTDLTLEDIQPLLPLAAQLVDRSRIHRYAIGAGQVYDWINYYGSMVLMPIREAVVTVMLQALNSP